MDTDRTAEAVAERLVRATAWSPDGARLLAQLLGDSEANITRWWLRQYLRLLPDERGADIYVDGEWADIAQWASNVPASRPLPAGTRSPGGSATDAYGTTYRAHERAPLPSPYRTYGDEEVWTLTVVDRRGRHYQADYLKGLDSDPSWVWLDSDGTHNSDATWRPAALYTPHVPLS